MRLRGFSLHNTNTKITGVSPCLSVWVLGANLSTGNSLRYLIASASKKTMGKNRLKKLPVDSQQDKIRTEEDFHEKCFA